MHAFISPSPLYVWKSAFLGLFILVLCLCSTSAEAQIYEVTQLTQDLALMQERMNDLKESQQQMFENVRADNDKTLTLIGILAAALGIAAPLLLNLQATSKIENLIRQNEEALDKREKSWKAQLDQIKQDFQLETDRKLNEYNTRVDEVEAMMREKVAKTEKAAQEAHISEQKSRFYMEEDHETRLILIDEFLKLNHDDSDIWTLRSSSNLFLRKYSEVIKDCNNAISLTYNDKIAYNNRGAAKFALKDYREAIKDFNKAIAIDSIYDIAYYNRGLAKHALKNFQGAIKDYEKAIEINPLNKSALDNLTLAQKHSKDHNDAIDAHKITHLSAL